MMTRKHKAKSLEYAVGDEAAAYIADALMEPKYAVTTNPSYPNRMTKTLSNSACSAEINPSERRKSS